MPGKSEAEEETVQPTPLLRASQAPCTQLVQPILKWEPVMVKQCLHRHMGKSGHGLPKFSPGPAMPYPSMPWGRATTETALHYDPLHKIFR